MEINIYNVIRGPRISHKVYRLNQTLQQLVLDVHPQSNKPLIAQALQKLFNVTPESIRTVVRKGKFKRAGRHAFQGKLTKKAYITLKPGQSIDMVNWTAQKAEQPVTQDGE